MGVKMMKCFAFDSNLKYLCAKSCKPDIWVTGLTLYDGKYLKHFDFLKGYVVKNLFCKTRHTKTYAIVIT